MGILRIACRITSVGNVDRIIGHLLDTYTLNITLPLLSSHSLDTCLLGIKIVSNRIHRIRGPLIDKLRASIDNLHSISLLGRFLQLHRIGTSISIDLLMIHIDPHEVCLQVHFLVLDISFFVNVNHLFLHLIHQWILILTVDHIIQKGFAVNRHWVRSRTQQGITLQSFCHTTQGIGPQQTITTPNTVGSYQRIESQWIENKRFWERFRCSIRFDCRLLPHRWLRVRTHFRMFNPTGTTEYGLRNHRHDQKSGNDIFRFFYAQFPTNI